MKYRRVGNSGIKVSEIGLGSWLTYGTASEQQAADACIRQAFDSGINFFDTANAYNKWSWRRSDRGCAQALQPFELCTFD